MGSVGEGGFGLLGLSGPFGLLGFGLLGFGFAPPGPFGSSGLLGWLGLGASGWSGPGSFGPFGLFGLLGLLGCCEFCTRSRAFIWARPLCAAANVIVAINVIDHTDPRRYIIVSLLDCSQQTSPIAISTLGPRVAARGSRFQVHTSIGAFSAAACLFKAAHGPGQKFTVLTAGQAGDKTSSRMTGTIRRRSGRRGRFNGPLAHDCSGSLLPEWTPWFAGETLNFAPVQDQAHVLSPNEAVSEEGTLHYLSIPAVEIGPALCIGESFTRISSRHKHHL